MLEILILMSLYGIYRIIREIAASRKCPNDAELRGVLLGRIGGDTARARKVKQHLGVCEKCRDRVQELTGV